MKKQTKIIIGAVVLAVAAGGIAVAGKKYQDHKRMHKMFSSEKMLEKLDANGDLAISMDEVLNAAGTRIGKADQNNDGFVTKAEIIEAAESQTEYPKLSRYSGRIADRIMARADINNDGKISKDEVENRLRKYHSLADWNDDGVVEMAEMKKMRELHGRHGKRRWKK